MVEGEVGGAAAGSERGAGAGGGAGLGGGEGAVLGVRAALGGVSEVGVRWGRSGGRGGARG